MQFTLLADKDTYITNRFVKNERVTGSNVGDAGTLDLFKITGSSGLQLSRLLVHFDLQPLFDLSSSGHINTSSPSFQCFLKLKDVYGGQTTPDHFTAICYPLSRSFDEGMGRDVVQYSDFDVANFSSASRNEAWGTAGCDQGGTTNCDYITNLSSSMDFETGEEDLEIDVTTAVQSIVSNTIPDSGFRISLSSSEETDGFTYFVKRFGTRKAYDASKRPSLQVRFDDSIQDDTGLIVLDQSLTLLLHNSNLGTPGGIVSGSSTLTGSNCIAFKLVTEVSGGFHELAFTGSQVSSFPGLYSVTINVPSTNSVVSRKLELSGAYKPVPVWGSLDGTVAFQTGSILTFKRKEASTTYVPTRKYDVSIYGLAAEVDEGEQRILRVNLFDRYSVGHQISRLPLNSVGSTVRDAYYAIRNVDTGETVVDFDKTSNTTRLSSDASGMWFCLYTHGMTIGHRFVIDIMTSTGGVDTIYRDVSAPFKVMVRR